jgi:DNA-binding NtrC family response regulator
LMYAWPGNIRELRNFLERAVLLCTGEVILPEHLPIEKMNTALFPSQEQPSPLLVPDLRNDIERLERDRVMEAMEACGGNQTRAAKMLGIARGTLSQRLDKFGIKRPRRR